MNQQQPLEQLYNHLLSQSVFHEQAIQFFFEHSVVIMESNNKEFCRIRYNMVTESFEFLSLLHTNKGITCTKEPVYILDIERKILEKKKRIS